MTTVAHSARKSNRASSFFYESRERRKILNQIIHYIKFSPGLIVLTGPTGSGRSQILNKLSDSFDRDVDEFCLLSEDSAVIETDEELYGALAAGFGLEEKNLEILEDRINRVQFFIKKTLHERRVIFIAVDDARLHSIQTIKTLLTLASENKGLTLILAGEDSLHDVIKKIQDKPINSHFIKLSPLSMDELSDFVHEYSKNIGLPVEPGFNRQQLRELMEKTGGNLSLLMSELDLIKPATPVLLLNHHLKSFTFYSVAMCVFVSLALLVWFYPGNKESKVARQQTMATQLSENNADNKAVVEIPDRDLVQQDVAPAVTSDAVYVENEHQPDLLDDQSSMEVLDNYYEVELMQRAPEHVTLQISSLTVESSVKLFIANQSSAEREKFSYYRRNKDGKYVYVLLYGDFINKHDALDALKNLTPDLLKSSPWPRTMAEVQDEILQGR